MSAFEDLQSRGLIQDVSDLELAKKLKGSDLFYVGLDPSAPALGIGNLVPIVISISLIRAGLKGIILFGGATGSIGDPSGKNAERNLLSREQVEFNVSNHRRTVSAILERAEVKAEFVDNYDWTRGVTMLDFLRDVGKYFTVNYMIAKDSVKNRLGGDGLSYTEFSYMLLQSFDFLQLYQSKNCRVQIGGSDQWGNLTAGLELIRKKIQGEALAFSWPLITDSQGRKFGKSESGSLSLDHKLTSPYRLHQYFLNCDDKDVVRYLKGFTFLSADEISQLEQATKAAPQDRLAQRALADGICSLVHGEQATADAKAAAQVLFGGSIAGLSSDTLLDIFSEVPSSTIARAELKSIDLIELLVRSDLVKSKGEAKKLIANGGAYLNNERIGDGSPALTDLAHNSALLILRAGKKNYHLVKLT